MAWIYFCLAFLGFIALFAAKLPKGTREMINYFIAIPYIGRYLTSWIIAAFSPYTGTIPLRVIELGDRTCVAEMQHCWLISNPFNSTHVAALLNFGECTMAMLILGHIESKNLRAIPNKMSIECLKKGRGLLRAKCTIEEFSGACEREVVTVIEDKDGVIAKVTGNWVVSETKKNI